MIINTYNVLVLGKTGVGKSTLINYLYGRKIRGTGTGKPVTKAGFHSVTMKINGLPVTAYDSWGLEAGSAKIWQELLRAELARRSPEQDISAWFHGVFYCIGAGGGRVEDFELLLIRQLLSEKMRVTVILTKADSATQEELTALREVVRQRFGDEVAVLPVCALGMTMGGGRKVRPFGRTELNLQASKDFWGTFSTRLPIRCLIRIDQEIDNWAAGQREYIAENIGRFITAEFSNSLEAEIRVFLDLLQKKIIPRAIYQEVARARALYRSFAISLALADINPVVSGLNLADLLDVSISYDTFTAKLLEAIMTLLNPIRLFSHKRLKSEQVSGQLDCIVGELKERIRSIAPEIEEILTTQVIKELKKSALQRSLEAAVYRLKDLFARPSLK